MGFFAVKTAPSFFVEKPKSNPKPQSACMDCKYVNTKLYATTGIYTCNLNKLETIVPTALARMEPYLCGTYARFLKKSNFKVFQI